MIIFGHRIPMVGSLILWAILWEIVGQLEVTILLPPLSAVLGAQVHRPFVVGDWNETTKQLYVGF